MSSEAAVRRLDLFVELPESELMRLTRAALTRQYEAGDVLFLEGQPCQGLWVITEGAVNIVKTTPLGRQLVIATQTGPAAVAEVPVFDGGPYPASVIAVQPTTAVLLWKSDLLAVCQSHPSLSLRFLDNFGKRLRHLVHLAERVTFGTIRQRLAAELLHQAELAGSTVFPLSETQEQLAHRLGTVREVISRNLARFQAEGFIQFDRRQVTILDAGKLRQEADTEF